MIISLEIIQTNICPVIPTRSSIIIHADMCPEVLVDAELVDLQFDVVKC
jgi:hypothetical protein